MASENKRVSISKTARFEVFKRDKFKCVYCGATAPDVLLQVDHIDPVANGGKNNLLNLATACFDCNNGKRARLLDDSTIIQKQRNQFAELQERREQIEMMLEWQQEILNLKDIVIENLKEYWESLAPGFSINDTGLKKIKKLIRDFSYEEIVEAMGISSEQYLIYSGDVVTESSWDIAYSKIDSIAKVKKDSKDNPDLKDLFYIRGILKNRIRGYFDASLTINLMKTARSQGVSLDAIKNLALRVSYMEDFEDEINDLIEAAK
jgi:hypothetical protein